MFFECILLFILIVNLIWEVLTKKRCWRPTARETGNYDTLQRRQMDWADPSPPVHPEVCHCCTAGQKKSLYWVRLYGNRDMCSAEVRPQLHHCDLGVCVVMRVQSMFHWSNTKKPGRTDTDIVTISTLYFCQTFFFLA